MQAYSSIATVSEALYLDNPPFPYVTLAVAPPSHAHPFQLYGGTYR